jgi:hypothetical protein
VLFSLGFAWLVRIAKVTEPDRFLSHPHETTTSLAPRVAERQV